MPNLPPIPALTVRAIKATPVEVPLNFVLGTSQGAIRQAPLLLIDLETEEGVTGRSYLFCYLRAAAPAIVSLLGEVEAVTKGDRVASTELGAKLTRRFMLIGVQGIVRMALAGFDVAAWDAAAIAVGVPLARMLGAEPRPIPAYNSCGLGLMDDLGALAAEAEKLLAVGNFHALKLRLGYPTLDRDIAAVHAVRKRVGDNVHLMVDYNQALAVDVAMQRGCALDTENIYWLEEPIRHDDYAGAAALARDLKTPIQIGENFSLPAAMAVAVQQGAADYVMPDSAGSPAGGRPPNWPPLTVSKCRRTCFRKLAPICWRLRRPAISLSMSIGRTCWCRSRSRLPTVLPSCRSVQGMAWSGTKTQSSAIACVDRSKIPGPNINVRT